MGFKEELKAIQEKQLQKNEAERITKLTIKEEKRKTALENDNIEVGLYKSFIESVKNKMKDAISSRNFENLGGLGFGLFPDGYAYIVRVYIFTVQDHCDYIDRDQLYLLESKLLEKKIKVIIDMIKENFSGIYERQQGMKLTARTMMKLATHPHPGRGVYIIYLKCDKNGNIL